MAYNPNYPLLEYKANAGQTLFPFNFKIFVTSDIVVYKSLSVTSTLHSKLREGIDYTVSINGDLGGTVTLSNTNIAQDEMLTLLRALPLTRPVEYQTSGDLLADTLNMDQDYQTYLIADMTAMVGFTTSQINTVDTDKIVLTFTATDGQTNFTATGSKGHDDIYVNGSLLTHGIDYTHSSFDYVLNKPAELDDIVTIIAGRAVSSGTGSVTYVPSTASLLTTNASLNTVLVQDKATGGIFNYDANQAGVNNGGTIYDGWVRDYTLSNYSLEWFGSDNTSVDNLLSIYGEDNAVVHIVQSGRGGTFVYDSAQSIINNGGTIFNGWVRQYDDIVYSLWFDADNTGATESTTKIQALLDEANRIQGHAVVTSGIYLIDTVYVKGTTKSFKTYGVLKGISNVGDAGVVSVGTSTQHINGVHISLKIDMSNGGRTAVRSWASQNCIFEECKIYGFMDHATLNHYGLLFTENSNYNKVINCRLEGFNTPTQRGLLVDFLGASVDNFGGFFTGAITGLLTPCVGNVITGCTLINGSYGVNLLGCRDTKISNNLMTGQNHRNIYMANCTEGTIVSNNTLHEYKSTAVLMAYGSNRNIVSDNKIKKSAYIGGEAAININTGAKYNKVHNNDIIAGTNYGVYIATDSSYNEIRGNTISNFYLSGVGIDSDWTTPRPTNANYARPNYESPVGVGGDSWSFNDLVGTVIIGNSFSSGYTGRVTAAISLSQINGLDYSSGSPIAKVTPSKILNTKIMNNTIVNPLNISYGMYTFEEKADYITGGVLMGNDFDSAITTFVTSFNTAGYLSIFTGLYKADDNLMIDMHMNGVAKQLTIGSATPSVELKDRIYAGQSYQLANISAIDITNFNTSITNGDEITVRLDTASTIKYGSGTIRTKGNVDIAPQSSNAFIRFRRATSVWFEQSRNF